MYNYKIFILESDALLIPSLIGFFGLHALLFIICKIIKKGTNFTNFTWDPFKGLLKHFFFCVQIAHFNSMFYKLVNLWAILYIKAIVVSVCLCGQCLEESSSHCPFPVELVTNKVGRPG